MTRAKRPGKKRPSNARAAKTRAAKPSRARRAGAAKAADAVDAMPLHVVPPAILTGGDVDTDQQRAADSGDEAVGGSVATPDQDVVDELGRALGVEQAPDEEVRTAGEILRERDRHRWQQEG